MPEVFMISWSIFRAKTNHANKLANKDVNKILISVIVNWILNDTFVDLIILKMRFVNNEIIDMVIDNKL